jgi:predicted porin
MQKKLIAVAVGGALAAIGAPALAQNATVNVFGTFYGEYARINNGRPNGTQDYQTYDHFQNPGSEIGFRGEEKLGGGLSAWFQCTASTDYRGNGNASATNPQAGSSWCNRNSALGLKGGFGNVFYGNWQTPFTRINNAGNVGSNDTGVFGNAHLMTGTSSTFGMSAPGQTNNTAGGTAVVAAGGAAQTVTVTPATSPINTVSPAVYRRRQNNLFTYETPSFGGFTAMGSVTTRNNASAATPAQLKARLWSVGAQYANGPIFVGASYEKHDNFYNRGTAAAPNAGDDRAWGVAASYTLPINLKLGGSVVQTKSDAVVNAQTKVTAFHFGIDWMISGPHGVRAGYTRAGDVKGPAGTAMNARPAANPNTKADLMQIRYVYALSKRSEVTAGYSRTNNRANAIYETGGSSTTQFPGSDSNAFAIAVRHTF